MRTAVLWVVVGLLGGVVAGEWLRPEADFLKSGGVDSEAVEDSRSAARIAELESQLRQLTMKFETVSAQLAAAIDREQAGPADAVPGEMPRFIDGVAVGPNGEPVVPFYRTLEEMPAEQQALIRAQLARMREAAADTRSSNGSLFFDSSDAVTADEAGSAAGDTFSVPANLTGIEARPGDVLVYEVTGSSSGAVWGSDIYTDDSSIAAAAVHAGVLQPGETGTLMLTILPGYASYPSLSRNGIDSQDWPEWSRSFIVHRLN
jgi:hypothetical protein